LAVDSPVLIDFIMQMAQTSRRAQVPFSLEHVDERTGDNVLHLLWKKGSRRCRWGDYPAVLRAAQRLVGDAQLLQRLDLLAVNRKRETPLMRLAALVNQQEPRRVWYPFSQVIPVPDWIIALPMSMLRAWQEARAPLVKSVSRASLSANVCG
jgi:hypothetical protein